MSQCGGKAFSVWAVLLFLCIALSYVCLNSICHGALKENCIVSVFSMFFIIKFTMYHENCYYKIKCYNK